MFDNNAPGSCDPPAPAVPRFSATRVLTGQQIMRYTSTNTVLGCALIAPIGENVDAAADFDAVGQPESTTRRGRCT
jgi:hypothetical protein